MRFYDINYIFSKTKKQKNSRWIYLRKEINVKGIKAMEINDEGN